MKIKQNTAIYFGIILVFIVMATGIVSADTIPMLEEVNTTSTTPGETIPSVPLILHGNVTLNGEPAPIGTEITAKLNEDLVGMTTVDIVGMYGDKPANKLFVSCGPEYYSDIKFYVNGIEAQLENSDVLNNANLGDILKVDIIASTTATNPSVCRDLPGSAMPGDIITVYLLFDMEGADKTVIEEHVPAGWEVISTSYYGVISDDKESISWVSQSIPYPIPFSYDVMIPDDAEADDYTFTGQSSLKTGQPLTEICCNCQMKVKPKEVNEPNICRNLPDSAMPGDTITVHLDITPEDAEKTVIEEHVPAGWEVTNISDNGVIRKDMRKSVCWISLNAPLSSTFSYDVSIPEQEETGYYTFDGLFSLAVVQPLKDIDRDTRLYVSSYNPYDFNHNHKIDIAEISLATDDYLIGNLPALQLSELIDYYLSGEPYC